MSCIGARTFVIRAAASLAIVGLATAAQAEDFFSALFGGFRTPPAIERPTVLPFAHEGAEVTVRSDLFGQPSDGTQPRHARSFSSGQAYCVRTCDGRYFPIAAAEGQSKAASCNSFCPASETKVVYGGNIEDAATDTGKPYSELPNAFRYRSEIVNDCTCNGKDSFGLARVDIENDKTLRRGDIVASPEGLMVAGSRGDRRSGGLNYSPASAAIRARYDRMPVVAQD